MYQPAHFQERRVEVLHDLMQAYPFATLVTNGPEGITANHLPMMLHPEISEQGTLRGHIARANPHWKDHDPASEVLAIFQGPHHYISPGWYPTKKEHGKAVPTWNYAVVHAHGPMKIIEDRDWLFEMVDSLTTHHEAGQKQPWAVNDAPEDYLNAMLKAIVGLEIPISRLEGKWKVSQNRSEADREGVIQGLEDEGTDIANALASST